MPPMRLTIWYLIENVRQLDFENRGGKLFNNVYSKISLALLNLTRIVFFHP